MKVQRLEAQIRQIEREIQSMIRDAQNADRALTMGELKRIAQLDTAQARCREDLLEIELGGCQ